MREPSPPAPVPGSTNSFSEHPRARPSRAIAEERAASAPALVHLASICTEVTDELIGSRCSYPAPTEDEQRTLSTFSPYIRQICLRWYVGLTKNIEPELNLQSSIPPASAREAARCSSVEWNEETGFSALWRRHESIYATVFFQTYLLFKCTQPKKREKTKFL